MIRLEDLDYELPPKRIAQEPVRPRDSARLLVLQRSAHALSELRFSQLTEHIGPSDLLVVNETRVRPARLRGHKVSGGRVEALLLEPQAERSWRALVKSSGRLRAGLELRFGNLGARVGSVDPDGFCRLDFDDHPELDTQLERQGEPPLPPYIRRDPARSEDHEDYQSIFARTPGAVAAPTASLHFTPELAARLPIEKLLLHVGPGTFRPLRGPNLDDHRPDPEFFEIPEATAEAMRQARQRGGRVIAVGTTVVRALETTGGAAGRGTTDLFIRPGHVFRAIDSMITNFHLPRSSLLALVMAFAGVDATREAYACAIDKGFRFYSYGDAMWIR